ncbi:hypothetical protein E1218_23315 [Kribbella turkmenica]|uniref:Uncharacterized protein n=1 Tax=Kribbella turkmenica TaxID=2530375 RepID=A0A4R4WP93_9ACTN|nr:hypothetical protein [Kribbella turkmenica]TDD19907.1 hypothetical protein E1218_23315 [Kribbella turkmenica]
MTSEPEHGKPSAEDQLEQIIGEVQRAADLAVPYALRVAVTLGLAEELAGAQVIHDGPHAESVSVLPASRAVFDGLSTLELRRLPAR